MVCRRYWYFVAVLSRFSAEHSRAWDSWFDRAARRCTHRHNNMLTAVGASRPPPILRQNKTLRRNPSCPREEENPSRETNSKHNEAGTKESAMGFFVGAVRWCSLYVVPSAEPHLSGLNRRTNEPHQQLSSQRRRFCFVGQQLPSFTPVPPLPFCKRPSPRSPCLLTSTHCRYTHTHV